jgi:hypothetical protein
LPSGQRHPPTIRPGNNTTSSGPCIHVGLASDPAARYGVRPGARGRHADRRRQKPSGTSRPPRPAPRPDSGQHRRGRPSPGPRAGRPGRAQCPASSANVATAQPAADAAQAETGRAYADAEKMSTCSAPMRNPASGPSPHLPTPPPCGGGCEPEANTPRQDPGPPGRLQPAPRPCHQPVRAHHRHQALHRSGESGGGHRTLRLIPACLRDRRYGCSHHHGPQPGSCKPGRTRSWCICRSTPPGSTSWRSTPPYRSIRIHAGTRSHPVLGEDSRETQESRHQWA